MTLPNSLLQGCIRMIVLRNKSTQKYDFVTILFNQNCFGRGWYALFIVIYNLRQISGFYHPMRAKTSDFKSLFPVFVFRKTVLTDFHHSHGLEEDDKLSKISPGGTNHNLFDDDFCRHSILEKMDPIVTSLNPCPSLPSVAKKKKGNCLFFND